MLKKVKEKQRIALFILLFFLHIFSPSCLFSLNPEKEITRYIPDVWGIRAGAASKLGKCYNPEPVTVISGWPPRKVWYALTVSILMCMISGK